MADNDFEKADKEAEVLEAQIVSIVPSANTEVMQTPKDIIEMKERLVKKYYKGASGLKESLKMEGKDSLDALIMKCVEEITAESDNLLGNGLVATTTGNLRDASVISFKRTEVLEKVARAVQAKLMFEKERGLDVESPAMRIVWTYFMTKVKRTFDKLGYPPEVNDIFYKGLNEEMKEWQRELKAELNLIDGNEEQ